MNYHIEALSTKNIGDLKQLYKAVFGNQVRDDYIHKKFDTAYLGKQYFGHLAYYNKQAIAFHGAVPFLMQHGDSYEISAQYGDAMTLPKHCGKGLFTQLGKRTDEQLKSADIRFVWGFPNQNSEYGYLNKLDWKYVERMQGFRIKTGTFPLEKIATKMTFTHRLFHQHLHRVLAKYKVDVVLKGSVFDQTKVVSTCRNQDFYRYKAFADNFIIELKNVLFWLKLKNGLLIGDVAAASQEDFDLALTELKRLAYKNGIRELIFQSSPNTTIVDLLKEHKTEQFESWIVGFKNFSSDFPLEQLKLTFGDLDTF